MAREALLIPMMLRSMRVADICEEMEMQTGKRYPESTYYKDRQRILEEVRGRNNGDMDEAFTEQDMRYRDIANTAKSDYQNTKDPRYLAILLKTEEAICKLHGFNYTDRKGQHIEITGKNGAPLNPEPVTVEIIDRRERVEEKGDG